MSEIAVVFKERLRAIAEIVTELFLFVTHGRTLDLNDLKTKVISLTLLSFASLQFPDYKKHALSRVPKLVEIIAAVPEEYKSILLPQ